MATTRASRSPRRRDALTRERIIETAITLLDADGEGGLTFRSLSARLATGPGAIYWHVANKDELLGAATEAVVAATLAVEPAEPPGSPQEEVRAVALGLYEAIDRHPWLSTQLATLISRGPGGSVTPQIFESLGRQIRALGVPESHWFTATSALMHYILGAASQNASNRATARTLGPGASRPEFLDAVSTAWDRLDPDDYPFTRAVADKVREHDDREQFLAGIDLILAGTGALR